MPDKVSTLLWNVVKPPARVAFGMVSRLHLMLRRHDYRYVFILGHMRSGSTLLAHVLANHPELVGAGETHVKYRSEADLPKLVLETCRLLRRPILRERYIVDQVNHDYLTDQVLLSEQVHRCIILLRASEPTLKSMMGLGIWTEPEAVRVYLNRLATLTHYGLLLKRRAMVVEYDDLVDRSGDVLAAMTRFLQLASPLSESYATHRMTARVAGYGDPSQNIKVGKIVRTAARDIAVSP